MINCITRNYQKYIISNEELNGQYAIFRFVVENNSLYDKENLMFIIKFSKYKMNEEEMEH